MQRRLASTALALGALVLASCRPGTEPAAAPTPAATVDAGGTAAGFAGIAADEVISLVGTEPFWGGTIAAGRLTYTTPENQAGDIIAVQRFAGNNGLGFSGTLGAGPLDVTITPGTCSDGMSDRSYPFTATLKIGAEQRSGCAWTERQRFSGAAVP